MKGLRTCGRAGRALCAALCLTMAWGGGGTAALSDETDAPGGVARRDMVWADYTGDHRDIYYSAQEKGGAWSEPFRISDGVTDSLLPCIVTTPAGSKFAVWTVMRVGRLGIMYAAREGEKWSDPKDVPDLPRDATMPFVAADDEGVLWLVFAGNDGAGQDDIYCARLRDGEWTKPERVNAPNDVPDINPFIEIGRDGAIRVTWEGFRNRGYVRLTTRRQNGDWTAEEVLPQDAEDVIEQNRKRLAEEKLPDFVRDRSMLFIRGSDE